MTMLTTAAILRLKPGKDRREIRDLGAIGHYLQIEPTGAKSFTMRFRRPDGRPAKLVLGPFDRSGKEPKEAPTIDMIGTPLTLAMSRALAAEVHRQRAAGRDVIADRAAAKNRRRAEIRDAAAHGFDVAVADYIAHAQSSADNGRPKEPKVKHWRTAARRLGLHYEPDGTGPTVIPGSLAERWAGRPVREIDVHAIREIVHEVRDRGVPGLDRHTRGRTEAMGRAMGANLSALFGWLRREGRVDANPCAAVDRPKPAPARDRVLTDAEIVMFWRACEALGEPLCQLLRLLLLTGARRTEVSNMMWSELSDDRATWTIPSSRTKNKRAHVVPLPPLAREILASIRPIANPAGYVFTRGTRPVGNWTDVKSRLDAAMGEPTPAPWVIHDLRRTFVTGLADLGIRPDVIELAVNHRSGLRGGIAGVYNKSELLPERRAALERWATHVEGLVSGRPGNVVTLRK
jgi:integrase